MQNASKNIDRILQFAKKEKLILSDSPMLKSALTKMYSKSTMHKQVENVVCKLIAEFENISHRSEAENG